MESTVSKWFEYRCVLMDADTGMYHHVLICKFKTSSDIRILSFFADSGRYRDRDKERPWCRSRVLASI